jgi:hypothetical protein
MPEESGATIDTGNPWKLVLGPNQYDDLQKRGFIKEEKRSIYSGVSDAKRRDTVSGKVEITLIFDEGSLIRATVPVLRVDNPEIDALVGWKNVLDRYDFEVKLEEGKFCFKNYGGKEND